MNINIQSFKFFSLGSYTKEHKPFEKAICIVHYLYYFLAYESIGNMGYLSNYIAQKNQFTPVWSISWARFLSYADTINVIISFFLVTSFLGVFFHSHRIVRILVFLGVFQLHAFLSSFIQPDHHWYPWVYVLFIFIFLPDIIKNVDNSELIRKKFLLVFLAAQAAILAIYTMAGLGKSFQAIQQIQMGEASIFDPQALTLHITYWLSNTNSTSILGSFIVNNPFIGWPFSVGHIYLQLFSLWIVVKPSLHRLWAFGLILFHISTFFTMNILFLSPSIFLLLMFFDSPFIKSNTTWRNMLTDLPIFGGIFQRFRILRSPK